ncbi:MAG TPA: hypothetical protein VJ760_02440 [Nitrospiraceae bacterium]|nr:hypothetical protein [Nitrospiraceae bacterium]
MNTLPQPLQTWAKDVDERLRYTSALILFLISTLRIGTWAAQRAVID